MKYHKTTDTNYDEIISTYKKHPFDSYGLFPIDENKELEDLDDDKLRIYDKQIDRTFFASSVLPKDVFKLFIEFRNNEYKNIKLNKLSIRIENRLCQGRCPGLLVEHKDSRSKCFDFPSLSFNKEKELLSHFYEESYDDSLWIKIEKRVNESSNIGDITFEELCNEPTTECNYYITQGIHLQYKKYDDSDEFYISHLDHENFYYTEEEYENRKTNIRQKGTGHQRIKTFKIDDSEIPFTLIKCSENKSNREDFFLYLLLDSFFEHKDLLKEYFENVLSKK